ncbi:hypothetical protein ASE17_17415 [Phenylobacterium sp. Root77]|uniref:hypothetical protein n=1 Tax=unclassified Phenylobacterium TaxID=2640670 RepID=UPI0006F7B883|nr:MULTISPECIES: hypothetical protein [unclassified Phenylobacterium]KQW70654.1 hypothetical protein ASC73_11285 [Phenylobacterium sp. Root1277]KQW90926.1 hypothetical protein ASC79_16305 [Phenylobacterium sp. Root1290]KRC39442.1 hypothetical protein ASE17_17415 [Phenylobacterium sp. Root77]
MRMMAALGVALLMALEINPVSAAEQVPVTAIDVLLVPDATMADRAQAANARLLKVYPASFTLDEAHQPHITLIQRFVRTDELAEVYAAVGRALAAAGISNLKLEAIKNYYTPGSETGVAGILVRRTPELLKLQQDMIAAVAPFTVETGPISAFTAPHDAAANDAMLIGYVATFVPKQTGENFNPHVSTGVAPKTYLDGMTAEPFEPFIFSPSGAGIYQLGPFGTAAKRLKSWEP